MLKYIISPFGGSINLVNSNPSFNICLLDILFCISNLSYINKKIKNNCLNKYYL